jgi:hypothetical protein
MGMLRACAAFDNGDALLFLGLVKPLFFICLTLLFNPCPYFVVG